MPVYTRSQLNSNTKQPNEWIQDQRTRFKTNQDQIQMNYQHSMRNPHHKLKEKMKALTLLYEQQKQASNYHKNHNHQNQPELNPIGNVMREKENTFVLPKPPVDKENVAPAPAPAGGGDRIFAFSCPRKETVTVARKLSLGPQIGTGIGIGDKNVEELGRIRSSKILVFVRLRPMGKKEKEGGSRCCVRIVNGKDIYLTEFGNENDYLRLKRVRGRHFSFDASFSDSSSQLEVYSTTTAELVEAVLQGRNGSVFCYGATGAGKTYTMLGTMENPGVMVLAIKDLFNKIRQKSFDGNHVVHLSYLEVYNETVRDLLSPGRPLVLREDKQGIVAAGLTQYRAYSTDEVMRLLQQGNQNRTTEPTRANETSSRSHAILQVAVEYRTKDGSNNIVSRMGKLSLIDLAGSERALATDQRTLRSLEGANINRSLLALSSCINALVEGKKHIPYRNSKLTQLLKDSLGGACNTVMIANISPSNLSFGETQNTLHWADRAKEIRTKACEANEEALQVQVSESETDQAKLLLELQKENHELRVQMARQQQKLLTIPAQALVTTCSPTPSTISSLVSTPQSSCKPTDKRKPRASFLTRNCFTPESKKKGAEETIRELRQTVKVLESEIERMKKDYMIQIKRKDDVIRELSRKVAKPTVTDGQGTKRILTRSSLRLKKANEGELKSPKHRFSSPMPTATKKRTFWDITMVNSPSVATLTGRKTRSHVTSEIAPAPSMLLQPGFARQRFEPLKH